MLRDLPSKGGHICRFTLRPQPFASPCFLERYCSISNAELATPELAIVNMTTYIPSLTLPEAVFNSPAASILLPITVGTAIGFSTRRM